MLKNRSAALAVFAGLAGLAGFLPPPRVPPRVPQRDPPRDPPRDPIPETATHC